MLSHARHSSFELASPLRTGHISGQGGWVHKSSGALSTRAESHSARREGLWRWTTPRQVGIPQWMWTTPRQANRQVRISQWMWTTPRQAVRIPQTNPRRAVRIPQVTFGGFLLACMCSRLCRATRWSTASQPSFHESDRPMAPLNSGLSPPYHPCSFAPPTSEKTYLEELTFSVNVGALGT